MPDRPLDLLVGAIELLLFLVAGAALILSSVNMG
jgi:hypothetical protein